MDYEKFMIQYYSSDSDDDIGSFVTQPPDQPDEPNANPLIPRDPDGNPFLSIFNNVADLIQEYDATDPLVPFKCVADYCVGQSKEACRNLLPQCLITTFPNEDLAPKYPIGKIPGQFTTKPWKIRQPVAKPPPTPPGDPPGPPVIAETFKIFWLITNITHHFPLEKEANYDFVVKSVANATNITTSLSLRQDTGGTWSTVLNVPPNWTITKLNSHFQITDDHVNRPNDDPVDFLVTWTFEERRMRYIIRREYEFVIPRLFETITLPSDCMFWRDTRQHPSTDTIGIGATNNGASEAFWDKNQVNDSTITLDQRQINEWSPPGHRHLEIFAPIWGNAQHNDFPMSVTLRNALDKPNNVTFYNGTVVPMNVNETVTLTRNVYLDGNPNICRRFRYQVNPFIDSTATGFTAFSEFTTQVPLGIRRQVYSCRQLVTRTWTLDENNVPTETLLSAAFAPTSAAFASSPFGNRPGYQQSKTIIEMTIWLFNWNQLLSDGLSDNNEPPLNLQFSGNLHIATSLQEAITQTGVTYANPYDEDPAKIGIVTIGNGFLGAPFLRDGSGAFKVFLSRQFNVAASLRVANLITLN